ncbi:hypothetical protein [Neobacillus sp. SAB-20_R2A]|uniref:hypothetical protein n=1 Tax=Neobacillus sp. SAB-20_R2A TaxID=3120519 RepID=UPI003C6E6382
MQMIIWAFGSMVLTLLVLAILRIGLTFKGKFLIASAAFVIALGGNAAVSTFPLWQTALMLLVLVFLIAYVFDSRMGAAIYQKSSVFAEEFDSFLEIEQPAPIEGSSIELKQQNILPQSILGELDKDSKKAELNSFVPNHEEDTVHPADIKEEDISFLLDRDTEEIMEHAEILEPTEGYMSDIESLLELETQAETEPQEEEVLDKIPGREVEFSDEELEVMDEDAPLDDALLEFLSADREAAAALNSEDTLEEIELDKKLSLSK